MVVFEAGTGNGLPSVDCTHPDNQRTVLHRGLSALAEFPGIVDQFPESLATFLEEGNLPSEIEAVLQFGIDFNNVLVAFEDIVDKGSFGVEIDVFVPSVRELDNGKKSISVPLDAKSAKAILLGITGVRSAGPASEIIFEGRAVPIGRAITTDNVFRIGLNPKTCIAHFDPGTIPSELRVTAPTQAVPTIPPTA